MTIIGHLEHMGEECLTEMVTNLEAEDWIYEVKCSLKGVKCEVIGTAESKSLIHG